MHCPGFCFAQIIYGKFLSIEIHQVKLQMKCLKLPNEYNKCNLYELCTPFKSAMASPKIGGGGIFVYSRVD